MNSDISSYSREKEIVRETIVAKIDQVNPVSDALSHVIQDVLGIAGVTAKVYVRYLVNGLSDTEYELARDTVLSEPPVDDILAREHIEAEAAEGKRVITIESLPGQYDARSDALQQCLMLQTGNKDHQVRVSSVVVLE